MLGCIQPMSSPMMKRMLGLACCCCAAAGGLVTTPTASAANRPSQTVLVMLRLLRVGCPRGAGSLRPNATAPSDARRGCREACHLVGGGGYCPLGELPAAGAGRAL